MAKDNEFRIGPNSGSGSDCWIRLGSHGTDTDTHAVLAYDADDNYISIIELIGYGWRIYFYHEWYVQGLWTE